jgi:GNAT superfamily N-acetyltransferase
MLKSIFAYISIAVQLFLDAVSYKSLLQLFREQVFFRRVVVPGTIDLTTLNCQQNPFQNSDYHLEALNIEDLRAKKWTFSIPNRYFRALFKMKKGLRGFGLLKDAMIIGDIWCLAPDDRNTPISYFDLDILGITCTEGDAYAADIFIDPAFRGKKLAVPLFLSMLSILKTEGCRRVYAYYYEDNTSSKWMHMMLKFKELPKLRRSRFFVIIKTYKYDQTNLNKSTYSPNE